MSYILEALKKSDQQRQQGAAPTLMSVPTPVEDTRQRTSPWLLTLAAIVFIAGILIGWLQPWKAGQTVATVTPPEERAAVKVLAVNPPSASPAPLSGPVDATVVARNQGQVSPPQPLQVPQAPAVRATLSALPANHAASVKELAPAAPAKSPGATEQHVIAKAELPPAIQQELPGMAVSLHAYSSKPSNRLVSINDKLLQEGDSLVPGLVLEEITRKDMIFTYKGFRFRQGVQ